MYIGSPLPRTTPQSIDSHYSRSLRELQSLRAAVIPSGDDTSLKRHIERGKLFVRDRITHLIDPGSPFLEIGQLTGAHMYEGVRPGAGLVTGIGFVAGHACMIVANDATVKGGTYFPLTVKKHLRAQEIAQENKLPCIYLVDSGGAYLPMQDEVFPGRDHFGRIFYNQANLSAMRIPQIAVVLGSCTAGGAYVPAMSDEAIIVDNQGTIFLGGPPLVKAATGEVVTAEELGGGRVHCEKSGVADYLAGSDEEALLQARKSVSSLCSISPTRWHKENRSDPKFSPEEIPQLLPADSKQYFPMREIIARLVDGSEIDEFKAKYGTSVICCFAKVEGYLVGIVANDGILFSESAQKVSHFVQLCDQRCIPLLFLQNIVGFMVGKEYEHRGIAKDGAKMVTAVSCTRVPKYTVIVGNSFGAGNYGMCGRAFQPRFLFSWPQAKIGVMGPEQAARVLTDVRQESYKAKGTAWSESDALKYRQEIEVQYTDQASAFYATARQWDDGIIRPEETRAALALAIGSAPYPNEEERLSSNGFGTFRM